MTKENNLILHGSYYEPLVSKIEKQLEEKIKLNSITPKIAIVYFKFPTNHVLRICKIAKEFNIKTKLYGLSHRLPETELLKLIDKLNKMESIHGIVIDNYTKYPPSKLILHKIHDKIITIKAIQKLHVMLLGGEYGDYQRLYPNYINPLEEVFLNYIKMVRPNYVNPLGEAFLNYIKFISDVDTVAGLHIVFETDINNNYWEFRSSISTLINNDATVTFSKFPTKINNPDISIKLKNAFDFNVIRHNVTINCFGENLVKDMIFNKYYNNKYFNNNCYIIEYLYILFLLQNACNALLNTANQ